MSATVTDRIDRNNVIFILDGARFQSGVFNYDVLKSGGVKMFIAKATQDNIWVDPLAEKHFVNFTNNGFDFGFYHFLDPIVSAELQFNHFIKTVNTIVKGDFSKISVLALDVEEHPTKTGNHAALAKKFMDLMIDWKKTKNIPCVLAVYTRASFIGYKAPTLMEYLLSGMEAGKFIMWYASYPYLPESIKGDNNFSTWENLAKNILPPTRMFWTSSPYWRNKDWHIWQFAGGGLRIPGYSGAIDLDVFNGGITEYNKLFHPNAVIDEEPTHEEKVDIMWDWYVNNVGGNA